MTEPWPHLPPPPPVLHPQELGLPVVWQQLCKHVPQSASPRLPPLHALAREETPQPGMWKGISTGFNEVGLLHPSAGLGDAGIPPAGPDQPWERSCPTWCRAWTAPKWHQGWFPAWGGSAGSISALQPGGHPPRALPPLLLQGAKEALGGEVVERRPSARGAWVGGWVQSTLVTLQNGGGPGTSMSSLAVVSSEDPFPGRGCVAQDV